jgi:hypothetical protein
MKPWWLAAAGFAVAMLPGGAGAEPGTPSWVRANAVDGGLQRRPAVELLFKGWKEKARFFVAVTRNGEPWQFEAANPGFSQNCSNDFPLAYHERYRCIMPARASRNAADDWVDRPGTEGYAMLFRNLEWGSEYCFRLRAQGADGEYAKVWTGWACARTAPRPPLPSPPNSIKVTGLPATSGAGVVGNGTPARLLVEWSSALAVAEFVVEKAPLVPNAGFERIRAMNGATHEVVFEHALAPAQPIQIRVCAQNVVGRACTAAKRFPPRSLKENAKAVDLPGHGAPPLTRADGAKTGPHAVPPTVPLTRGEAAAATAPAPGSFATTPHLRPAAIASPRASDVSLPAQKNTAPPAFGSPRP